MPKQQTTKDFILGFLTAIFLFGTILTVYFFIGNQVLAQEDIFGVNYGVNVGLGTQDIRITIVKIIRTALGVLGIIALILIIYGGVVWMTAGGRRERIELAKKILLNAVIGLLIIMMAFAIVQYIFKVLGGAVTGPGIVCNPGEIRGQCELCVTPPPEGRWQWQYSWPGCSISPEDFIIKNIITSCENPPNFREKVYLCSAVSIIFNHQVDTETVKNAVENLDRLYIEQCGDNSDFDNCKDPTRPSPVLDPVIYSGSQLDPQVSSWFAIGKAVTFAHPGENLLFEKNTYYRLIIPKGVGGILDTEGKGIQSCGELGLGQIQGCKEVGDSYQWIFQTGEETDVIPPSVVSTYPISDRNSPNYPDRNVNLKPTITAIFDEAIGPWSILPSNITLTPVSGVDPVDPDTTGTLGSPLDPSLYTVDIDGQGNGFELQLGDGILLEPFTWYQVEVNNIVDLCGLQMKGLCTDDFITQCEVDSDCLGGGSCQPYVWRFQTNYTKPGVAFVYPPDGYQNACPDTEVFVMFNTSMYDAQNTSCAVLPSLGGFVRSGGLTPVVTGRVLDVLDPIPASIPPGKSVNNYCKKYGFIPTSVSLQTNTDYQAQVNTRMVMDIAGNTLLKTWNFHVTDPESCLSPPYIERIAPNQGPKGECVSIIGKYFKGSAKYPAEGVDVYFETTSVPDSQIGSWSDTIITTIVPDVFKASDRPKVKVTVTYKDPGMGSLSSNDNVEFYVNSDKEAQGPCLWKIEPNFGKRGEDGINLSGIRFTPDPEVYFALLAKASFKNWGDEKIEGVTIPLSAIDGDVFVMNANGFSNPLPFDVQYCGDNIIDPGEECDSINLGGKNCQNFGFVGGTLACSASCKFDTSNCSNAPSVIENPACDLRCIGGDKDGNLCTGEDKDCPQGICEYGTLASPNPYKNQKNVCLNIKISARFNTLIDDTTVNDSSFFIQKCQDPECTAVLPDHLTGTISIFSVDALSEGIEFTPATNLLPNTAYQVTLLKAITSEQGVPMQNDYVWQFTTKADLGSCLVHHLTISPANLSLGAGVTYPYSAYPIGEACTILSGDYEWTWTSDNEDLATVVEDPIDDSKAQVTSNNINQGVTYINAETEGKRGRGRLEVRFDTCAFNPNVCPNPEPDIPGDECPGSICDIVQDRCTPVVLSLSPDTGPAGRWSTIFGCHFEEDKGTKGKVEFEYMSVKEEVEYYPCADSWYDQEIIIEVPKNLSLGNYNLKVTTNHNLESNTDQIFSVINQCLPGIAVPSQGTPGLCSLKPDKGREGDLVLIEGANFDSSYLLPDDNVTFNGLPARIFAPITSWADTKIETQVPSNALTGEVIAQVDQCPSNGLNFTIKPPQSCDTDPKTPLCNPNDNLCTEKDMPICNLITCLCEPGPPPNIIAHEPPNICQGGTRNGEVCISNSDCQPGGTCEPSINVCRNILISATFDQLMDRGSLNSNIILEGPMAEKISGAISIYDRSNPAQSVVNFSPSRLLDKNTRYKVTIKGGVQGVKSRQGGRMTSDFIWHFTTGNEICQINQVEVTIYPPEQGKITNHDYFTCASRDDCQGDQISGSQCIGGSNNGSPCSNDSDCPDGICFSGNQHRYLAQAKDKENTPLTASYKWEENDSGNIISFMAPVTCSTDLGCVTSCGSGSTCDLATNPGLCKFADGSLCEDLQNIYVTALPKNGEARLKVTASGENYGSVSQNVSIKIFLCENPWPSLALFPYEDSSMNCNTGNVATCLDANFSIYYCRDKGSPGETDDLPALKYNPPNQPLVRYQTLDILKEFLFLRDDDSKDALGIRIYKNPEHLLPSSWYQENVPNPGSPQSTQVDGYEAVRDGRTVYVNAANLAADGNLYTNIYLISYNEGADAETINIYNQLLDNLEFNINLGPCPAGTICCPKDKIIRDTKRLGDLEEIVNLLEDYQDKNNIYPLLEAGTYLKGISTSKWPSWRETLGALLGKSLPQDPINEFTKEEPKICDATYTLPCGKDLEGNNLCCDKTVSQCVNNKCLRCPQGYDSQACWYEANKEFLCQEGSHIYMYQVQDGGQSFNLYANFEYSPATWQDTTPVTIPVTIPDPCSGGSSCACFNYERKP